MRETNRTCTLTGQPTERLYLWLICKVVKRGDRPLDVGERTVPIPSFDARGLLPPFVGTDAVTVDRAPYRATMTDLVASLGTTSHRRTLIRNLIDYRALLASDGYSQGLQFLDGSFVEDIEGQLSRAPSDIDLFSILDLPTKYQTDPAAWQATGHPFWVAQISDRAHNKTRYSLDTYAVLLQEIMHGSGIRGLIDYVIYWYSLFSHQKNTFAWKGFVAIELNPADDALALAALGTP